MRAMYYHLHTQIQKDMRRCKLLSCFISLLVTWNAAACAENVMNANTVETISVFIKPLCYDLSLFYLIFLYLIMHKGAMFMQSNHNCTPNPIICHNIHKAHWYYLKLCFIISNTYESRCYFNLPFKIRDIHHFAHNNLSRIFSIWICDQEFSPNKWLRLYSSFTTPIQPYKTRLWEQTK